MLGAWCLGTGREEADNRRSSFSQRLVSVAGCSQVKLAASRDIYRMSKSHVDDGRMRAALRVRQRRRSDSKRWTIDGKRRRNKRPSTTSATANLPTTPWNERFVFDDEKENVPNRRASVKFNPPARKNKTNNTEICHFSERADGELTVTFSRYEIAPKGAMRRDVVDNEYGESSTFFSGTQDASVSPFDMIKLRRALEDDEGDDSEMSVANDEYRTQNYSHSPREVKQSHTMPQFDAQDANANLEAFEELLYTVEIEEELVHRELVRKTQTHSNEEKKAERCLLPDDIISSESQTASMSKLEIQPAIIPKAKQEEIYNYVWYSKMRTCEREKNLIKDELNDTECHKVVEM
eukprot:scaffold15972_cov73-Cyclotella_meneghiniana.AAC.4